MVKKKNLEATSLLFQNLTKNFENLLKSFLSQVHLIEI